MPDTASDSTDPTSPTPGHTVADAVAEVKKVVVGQDRLVERAFV